MAKHLWGVSRTASSPSLPVNALAFPYGNYEAGGNIRMALAGSARPDRYPSTYIWRITPKEQAGYFCTYFFTRSLTEDSFIADYSYEGCHLYPYGGTAHWEISHSGTDTPNDLGGVDSNGYSTAVEWDREYIQAVRKAKDGGGNLVIEFFYDIAAGLDRVIRVPISAANMAASGEQTVDHQLIFFSSPWTPLDGDTANEETIFAEPFGWLQIYSAALTDANLLLEAANTTSNTPRTAAGLASLHYINNAMTPSDVSDKSEAGHNPTWVGDLRPTLWTP